MPDTITIKIGGPDENASFDQITAHFKALAESEEHAHGANALFQFSLMSDTLSAPEEQVYSGKITGEADDAPTEVVASEAAPACR